MNLAGSLQSDALSSQVLALLAQREGCIVGCCWAATYKVAKRTRAVTKLWSIKASLEALTVCHGLRKKSPRTSFWLTLGGLVRFLDEASADHSPIHPKGDERSVLLARKTLIPELQASFRPKSSVSENRTPVRVFSSLQVGSHHLRENVRTQRPIHFAGEIVEQ